MVEFRGGPWADRCGREKLTTAEALGCWAVVGAALLVIGFVLWVTWRVVN